MNRNSKLESITYLSMEEFPCWKDGIENFIIFPFWRQVFADSLSQLSRILSCMREISV